MFVDEYHLYYAFAHFQAGRYAEAATAAEAAILVRPGHPVLHLMAAASHSLGGAPDRAQASRDRLLALVPSFSAGTIEQTFFYHDPADRKRLADGLRQAGLPD